MTSPGSPDRLLLLYSDASDPVARVLLEQSGRFDREVVTLSLARLLNDVRFGSGWSLPGLTLAPDRTAVVNRLVLPDAADAASPFPSFFEERQFWRWLVRELQRFSYVSALPTATSMIGGYGSFLDQWLDLPGMVGGLRVPLYQPAWDHTPLHGDVYRVDPWNLYSLGSRPAEAAAGDGRLAYVRPHGPLVHVSQVGGTVMLVNAPPHMSGAQQAAIVAFTNTMALQATTRILEHAFFVGDDAPVFYSTCPTPVITGTLPDYPSFLAQGLRDDIARRGARAAS